MFPPPWNNHAYISRSENENGKITFSTFTDKKMIGYGVRTGNFRASFSTKREARRDLDAWWKAVNAAGRGRKA